MVVSLLIFNNNYDAKYRHNKNAAHERHFLSE